MCVRPLTWFLISRSFVVWKPADFARDLLPLHFKVSLHHVPGHPTSLALALLTDAGHECRRPDDSRHICFFHVPSHTQS